MLQHDEAFWHGLCIYHVNKVNYRLINGHDWPVVNSKTKKVNTFTPPDLGETLSLPFLFVLFNRFSQFPPFFESILDDFFMASPRWFVKDLSAELVRQIILRNKCVFMIVRIHITFAVANIFHQPCRRISYMERHGQRASFTYCLFYFSISNIQ